MSKSTIATVALFFGISRWNGYFWARQMISNANEHPLQVFIRLKLEQFTDPEAMAGWNEVFASDSVIYALIVCSIVPILIIYPFIQKYFAKGVNVGGVKELAVSMLGLLLSGCGKKIDVNQYAGLLMMGLDYGGLVVKRVGDGFELQRLYCKNADRGGKETFTTITALAPTSKDKVQYKAAIYEDIYLRMVVKAGGKVTFYYSPDGKKYTKCGDEFKMREGKWIGAKMGFVSIEPDAKTDRGWIDVDWFRVTK